MSGEVTYRHNIMEIASLDTFFSVRGGFHDNIRDVYFVRALGECAGFSEKIREIDQRMGTETCKGRLGYVRIGELPNISGEDKIRTYAGIYDRWKKEHALALPREDKDGPLNEAASAALRKTEEIYRDSKKNVSDSMLRNFGIKILFWFEEKAGSCFRGWNEKSCIKIVLENVVKEQEYLFGYFLSLLGCDVLLLENRSDVTVPEAMKNLSKTMTLGAYGTVRLCSYEPYAPSALEKIRDEAKPSPQPEPRGPVKIVIPERAGRQRTQRGQPAAARTEKSFEELARMASSIVMITVHDAGGEAIGNGSGIMIGRDGYILTNHHVVARGRAYSVRIEDDETIYPTNEVIKYNSVLDMAVIRIDRVLKPLSIYRGNTKLVRGQKVVAIGSPLGLFNSVSDGIISGFRNIRDTDMIQFTAPISPGSSGGAVLNMYGEVIGISTAGFDSGQNINLAVGYESILMFAKGFFG